MLIISVTLILFLLRISRVFLICSFRGPLHIKKNDLLHIYVKENILKDIKENNIDKIVNMLHDKYSIQRPVLENTLFHSYLNCFRLKLGTNVPDMDKKILPHIIHLIFNDQTCKFSSLELYWFKKFDILKGLVSKYEIPINQILYYVEELEKILTHKLMYEYLSLKFEQFEEETLAIINDYLLQKNEFIIIETAEEENLEMLKNQRDYYRNDIYIKEIQICLLKNMYKSEEVKEKIQKINEKYPPPKRQRTE